MTVGVEQGKGVKDHYVPLADRLLQDLRAHWATKPPRGWLFPYRQGTRLSRAQRRARQAIDSCRIAALGGHRETCDTRGAERLAYNSCRNRHCPNCQALATARWLDARRAGLLPVESFHVVFTLPHALNALAQGNPPAALPLPCRLPPPAPEPPSARRPRRLQSHSG